jgi:DNA transposition AAA+ family ATPase
MSDDSGPTTPEFLITEEYRRFAEFCEAVRRERYSGVCHGAAGVGKTLSARHYAQWDQVVADLVAHPTAEPYPAPAVSECRTLFYTPTPTVTPKLLTTDLHTLSGRFNAVVTRLLSEANDPRIPRTISVRQDWAELVIVDEADRLKFLPLEQLRDLYDRGRFGLALIGMPGLEKRLAHYPQLYSRIGFVHQYRRWRWRSCSSSWPTSGRSSG